MARATGITKNNARDLRLPDFRFAAFSAARAAALAAGEAMRGCVAADNEDRHE